MGEMLPGAAKTFSLNEIARAKECLGPAMERYKAHPEVHRLKRYLHVLNQGKVRCPKAETLRKHSIEIQEDGTFARAVKC